MDTNDPEMVMYLEAADILTSQDSEYPYFQSLKEKGNQIVLICLR